MPGGRTAGRTSRGTDRLAVVPQLTMGIISSAPVPSTSQARSPAPMTTGVPASNPKAAAADRDEPTADPVRRDDRRQPVGRFAGQLIHHVAVEVVQTAARGHGGVGDHLAGEPPDHEVPRSQEPGAGGQSLAVVRSQPDHLGRHRTGVERHTGSVEYCSAATQPAGHRLRFGAGAAVRPHDRRPHLLPFRVDGHERLPGSRASDGIDRTEPTIDRGARPRPAAGHRRRPPTTTTPRDPAPTSPVPDGRSRPELPEWATSPSWSHRATLVSGGAQVDREDHRPCTTSANSFAMVAGDVS